MRSGDTLRGIVPVLDVKYGNVWTNIPKSLFDELHLQEHDKVQVRIFHKGKLVDKVVAPYEHTFGGVAEGKPLVYLNSLLEVALALNQGNYAAKHHVASGVDWEIEVAKAGK